MKRRKFLTVCVPLLLVVALLVTACAAPASAPAGAAESAAAPAASSGGASKESPGTKPAEQTQNPAPADGPQYAGLDKDLTGVTIKMANIGGAPYEAMYDSVKVFEEKTHAKVQIVFLGDGFQIDRYLKQNYAAGTVDFDVAWNHTSFMSQYVDFVEPLQSYFSQEELAAFSPAIIQAATVDGNLQLIPRHADISAMHYRTDLFGDKDLQTKFKAKYNYDLTPPTTVAQMKDMAEFFVAEGKIDYGTQFAGKEEALAGRFYELLVANGGNFFDDKWEPTFTSDAGKMTAQWMTDLYAAKAIPKDTTNLLWPEVAQNFCDGKVAFYLEWYGWYSYFQDASKCKVAGKFDLARGPLGAGNSKHTGWAGAHAFSVTKASQNKEAAVQLIKFLTSRRVAYEESKLGLLPVRNDVWQLIIEDAAKSDRKLDKARLELAQQQISEDFFTPPLFADWISFTDKLYPILQSIILGDTSVDDGLQKAADETKTMLGDLGYYK